MNNKRVLIYRLGSLGDSVIALPAFHLIAQSFTGSERRVLTNLPISAKEAPLSAILGNSGLVHGYMEYPLRLRNIRQLNCLRSRIRRWKPDVLIYLAPPRGRIKAFRDALFFRTCGIKILIGVPFTKKLQENQWIKDKCCYEQEAARLVRCISGIGDIKLEDSQNWDLHLNATERERASKELRSVNLNFPFIACSVGTKVDVKDWGKENWQTLIRQLSKRYRNYGLVLIGSRNEFNYSEQVISHWTGTRVNLCGILGPRESAAVLKMAEVFVGHDSGPMHLSAAVGTPCVGIFSARNKPGIWFPYGLNHKVLYHKKNCYDCRLDMCNSERKKCIMSITPDEVENSIIEILFKPEGSIKVE